MEIWKEIEDYPGYEISNQGRVKSKGLIRSLSSNKLGYKLIVLSKNGARKAFCVHRLVAKAFIPNPENKPTVDHKDRNKANNWVENLRWATRLEQSANYPKRKTDYEFGSMYRGVSWAEKNCKFRARLEVNGKNMISPSLFDTELEAGRAYHKKSKELYGEFYDGQPQYPELNEE